MNSSRYLLISVLICSFKQCCIHFTIVYRCTLRSFVLSVVCVCMHCAAYDRLDRLLVLEEIAQWVKLDQSTKVPKLYDS